LPGLVRHSTGTGVSKEFKFMKKRAFGIVAASAFAIAALAAPVGAAQPANPGCFGTSRAENITTDNIPAGPGASGWGHLAADRAETNGDQNRAWMLGCGGVPA
jgi:hypothetical protein